MAIPPTGRPRPVRHGFARITDATGLRETIRSFNFSHGILSANSTGASRLEASASARERTREGNDSDRDNT